MAKEMLTQYQFIPGAANAGVLKLNGNVHANELLIVTNVTDNTIIYNFADATVGLYSHSYDNTDVTTFAQNTGNGVTTITLKANTSSQDSTDSLLIYADLDNAVEFKPERVYRDPVSKIRVSNPQNQIDTDFEYGLQSTKWESLDLVNNIPTIYSTSGDTPLDDVVSVLATNNSKRITVTTLERHDLSIGDPISIQGLDNPTAEGFFLIYTIISDTSFVYKTDIAQNTTSDLSGSYTTIIPCKFFSSASIQLDESSEVETNGLSPNSTLVANTKFETGLKEKTKLYIRNTYSGITSSFNASPSSTADDGRPYIDTDSNLTVTFTLDPDARTGLGGNKEYPIRSYDWEGSYSYYFDASNVNAGSDTITWTEHKLQTGYCLLFSTPKDGQYQNSSGGWSYLYDGNLEDGRVYFVEVTGADTIKLYYHCNNSNPTSGQSNPYSLVNLTAPNYYNRLSLVYWSLGSGGGGSYERYSKSTPFRYWSLNQNYNEYSGSDLSSQYSGGHKQWGLGGSADMAIAIGGLRRTGTYYGNYDPHAEHSYNRQYTRYSNRDPYYEYGTGSYASQVGDGRFNSTSLYDSNLTWRTSDYLFYCWANRLTERNTIYKVSHGLETGDIVTITSASTLNDQRFTFESSAGNINYLSSPFTAVVTAIDDDNFSITTNTGSYQRIAYWPDGDITFDVEKTNTKYNSVYLKEHGVLTETTVLKYSSTGTAIGGLSSGSEYSAERVDDDRLKLSVSGTSPPLTVQATTQTNGGAIGTAGYGNYFYYVDIETPSGGVPTQATIVGVEYRGDFGDSSEYVFMSVYDSNGSTSIRNHNIGASGGQDTSSWLSEAGWASLDISSALVTNGGKSSIYCRFDPTTAVNYAPGGMSNWWEIRFIIDVVFSLELAATGSGTHKFTTTPQRGAFDGPFELTAADGKELSIGLPISVDSAKRAWMGDTQDSSILTFDEGHGFTTGQKLLYESGGFKSVLPSGEKKSEVYAVGVNSTDVKLASSQNDAFSNTTITLEEPIPDVGTQVGAGSAVDTDTIYAVKFEGTAGADISNTNAPDLTSNAIATLPVYSGNASYKPEFQTTQSKWGATSVFGPTGGGAGQAGTGIGIENSVAAPGYNDWTIEGWFYWTRLYGYQTPYYGTMPFSARNPTNNDYFYLRFYDSLYSIRLFWGLNNQYGSVITSTNAWSLVSLNTWHHLALVKSSSQWYLFLNGVPISGLNGVTGNYVTNSWTQYRWYWNGYAYYNSSYNRYYSAGNCYMEDLRLSHTARYTSDFSGSLPGSFGASAGPVITPNLNLRGVDKATQFYIPSNTSNNNTAFSDHSSNQYTVGVQGQSKHSTVDKKFGTSSVYFDGASDSLYVSNLADREAVGDAIGSGDFTAEMWYKASTTDNQWEGLFKMGNSPYLCIDSTPYYDRLTINQNGGLYHYTGWTNHASWSHIALVRKDSYLNLYLNGTAVITNVYNNQDYSSSAVGYSGTDDLTFGRAVSGYSQGYMEEMRISASARYATNFTAPKNPGFESQQEDLYLEDTRLLIQSDHSNGTTNFSCTLHPGHTVSNTNVSHNATVSKFTTSHGKTYNSSMYFNGSNAYLSLTSSGFEPSSGNVLTGDYTIETWLKFNGAPTADQVYCIFDGGTNLPGSGFLLKIKRDASNNHYAIILDNNSAEYTKALSGISNLYSDFHHFALVRRKGITRLYVDGVQKCEITDTRSLTNGAFRIGATESSTQYFIGYMEEFRITSHRARYLGDFSPPTTLHPNFQDFQKHSLNTDSVISAISGAGTISVTADSNVIIGDETVFKSTFKRFDNIYVTQAGFQQKYSVEKVLTDTKLIISSNFTSTGTELEYQYRTDLMPRPDGYNLHRPYDGGVEITAGTSPNAKIVRQTRRYFRYQSGKGVQCSVAVNFSPSRTLSNLTASGTTARASTQEIHNLNVDDEVIISDAGVTGGTNHYEGAFNVASVIDSYTFTYTMAGTPANSKAIGYPEYARGSWSGTAVRCGMFDDQNGMFFEYDGSTLYAVRRNSTQQLSGDVDLTRNSSVVTGNTTSFQTQLSGGDHIVARGQTYKVISITSDLSMEIQPAYRGKTATNVKLTKRKDEKVAQDSWSIDKCDGTGKSKYTLDIHKTQMVYLDYSWYGAGSIRFGFKGIEGEVIHSHTFLHNNKQTEAYWRSGNMPGRYEVENDDTTNNSPTLMHWGTSIIMDGEFDDDKAYLFTASSKQFAFTGGNSYTANMSANSYFSRSYYSDYKWVYVLRLASSVAGSISAGQLVRDANNTALPEGTTVKYYTAQGATTYVITSYPQIKTDPTGGTTYPEISSGTAITFGETSEVNLGAPIPLVSVRLAPSVDSGLTGDLGEREIINRMLVKLKECAINSSLDIELQLLLNAELDNDSWIRANTPSLCEVIYHNSGDTIGTGTVVNQVKFAAGSHLFDISTLLELGNSVLGGDSVFPDGPDALTLAVLALDTGSVTQDAPFQVSGKITWTESQA